MPVYCGQLHSIATPNNRLGISLIQSFVLYNAHNVRIVVKLPDLHYIKGNNILGLELVLFAYNIRGFNILIF